MMELAAASTRQREVAVLVARLRQLAREVIVLTTTCTTALALDAAMHNEHRGGEHDAALFFEHALPDHRVHGDGMRHFALD